MKLRFIFRLLIPVSLLFASCKKSDDTLTPQPPVVPQDTTLYFPAVGSSSWDSYTPGSLQWDTTQIQPLYDYLATKNSKAFIVLYQGRIVLEKYFGTFRQDSLWYWASAGKTLTAMLVGIAQREGHLSLNDKSSDYLGTGWTSLPLLKENLITVRHQVTMTTGLDDGVADSDCTDPACLTYKADAGTRWAYHNAPYTILDQVIAAATGQTFNNYFAAKIRNVIGMTGQWVPNGYNHVYYSNARSMARYGLLLLNKGSWSNTAVLGDSAYFAQQISSSQNLNPSYGYLTWLNGKASYMLPSLQTVFQGPLVPNGYTDMFMALGKNDQKIYVVPSKKLVVIRMGESAGNIQLALSSFDNELWGKIRQVIR